MASVVTQDNFTTEVLESEDPVVVEFTAPNRCAPCRAMVPVFKELEAEYDAVKFVTVNPDENTNLRDEYSVMAVPTFIRFENGSPVKIKAGSGPKPLMKRELFGS